MTNCPRCQGNGIIYKARIIKTQEIIYLCDECDAVWDSPLEFHKISLIFSDDLLRSKGLQGLWDELDVEGPA